MPPKPRVRKPTRTAPAQAPSPIAGGSTPAAASGPTALAPAASESKEQSSTAAPQAQKEKTVHVGGPMADPSANTSSETKTPGTAAPETGALLDSNEKTPELFSLILGKPAAEPPVAIMKIPDDTRWYMKGGRKLYATQFKTPRLTPVTGFAVLSLRANVVHSFEYCVGIPTIQSSICEPSPAPAADEQSPRKPNRLVTICPPVTAGEIEAHAPGYTHLPEVKWVQLNDTGNEFVVQLKLQKLKPVDVRRDTYTGEIHIYGAASFVVQAASSFRDSGPAATEKSAILAI